MGAVVEGVVTSIQKFGAFVQIAEGVEGMVHVGDISAEKRINHPQDVLKMGQTVKAQVLELETAKRRLRLGMKQLVPTSLDEYIARAQAGRRGDGPHDGGFRRAGAGGAGRRHPGHLPDRGRDRRRRIEPRRKAKRTSLSLSSMLASKWKGGEAGCQGKREPARAGQIRSFRIVKLDAGAKRIELELA